MDPARTVDAAPFANLARAPAVARVAPFAIYIAFLMLLPLIRPLFPDFDARWFYAVQIGAVILALAIFGRSYSELSNGIRPKVGDWLLAIVAGVLVFVVWVNLEFSWAMVGTSSDADGFDPRQVDGSLNWPLVVARIFGAALVVPIMEELFWRSFIMRWIDRKDFLRMSPAMVSLRAVLVSSIVFGFEHSLWFAGILAGLAYAWLYVRSGNLWLPIVAHATTNLLLGVFVVTTHSWRFW